MKKLAKEEVLRIVRELHAQLDIIYGDRLKGVYLYGSYARGDAREDSDIDVAVVLSSKVDAWEEIDKTGDIISETVLREDCFIQPLFVSEEEFHKKHFAVLRDIAAEGIPV